MSHLEQFILISNLGVILDLLTRLVSDTHGEKRIAISYVEDLEYCYIICKLEAFKIKKF
jgi:hypothetical protein